MVANEPADHPDDPEPHNPWAAQPPENEPEPSPDEFDEFLLRRLGDTPPPPPVQPDPVTDDAALNERFSAFFADNDEPKEKNETWLDSFWKNDVPESEKQEFAQQAPDDAASSADTQQNVSDDFLYQEWMRLSGQNADGPRETRTETPTENTARIFDFEEPANAEPQQTEPNTAYDRAFLFEDNSNTFTPTEVNSSIFSTSEDRSGQVLEEMRSLIKEELPAPHQDAFVQPAKLPKERKAPLKFTRLEIILISLIIVLVLATGLIIIRGTFFVPAISAPPASTAILPNTPESVPSPTELIMTGGWKFQLNKNTMVDDLWNPTGPEWFAGTEVSRIVALPWSPQLEAILPSLKPGDPITLLFDNQSEIIYKIEKVEQISATQAELMNNTTPSLVIFLYGQNSPSRWVITSLP